MKYAAHSIAWGHDADIRQIASDIRGAGYQGVELFQHPARTLKGAKKVFDTLAEFELQLIGVSGGSFSERCLFVQDYIRELGQDRSSHTTPYVYIDEWREPEFPVSLGEGLPLALHPHMFKMIQTMSEAEALLNRYPRLRLLPDTAHLTIAGDNPVSAIQNNQHRLAGIHFKDWHSNVGRSYQFYSRGFCPLGEGDIDLIKVLAVLHHFDGWLVVEQDTSQNPRRSIETSLAWLSTNSTRDSNRRIG